MLETELAYAAGILDGEGSVRSCLSQGYWRPEITICNTYEPLLDWFIEKFKGRKRIVTGVHQGNFVRYVWGLYATDDVRRFAKLMLPYSKIKKAHLEAIIEFTSEFRWRNGFGRKAALGKLLGALNCTSLERGGD